MLVNAAVYRAMTDLRTIPATGTVHFGDPRGFGMALEGLAQANMAATTCGIFALSTAMLRLAMLPRWTGILPAIGIVSLVGMATVGEAIDNAWLFLAAGFFCQGLWLLICGSWLLFGGSKSQSLPAVPAPAV